MFPNFHTERLVFRAVDEDHNTETVLKMYSDPGTLASTMLQLAPLSRKSAKAIMEDSAKMLLSLMVCLPANEIDSQVPGTVVGRISLGPMDDQHSYFDIVIAKEFQGRGYGTEALGWLLEWAFICGRLRRVEGNVFAWNTSARKLYSKMGFVQEGVKREHHWYNGKWQDTVQVGILESNWKALRA